MKTLFNQTFLIAIVALIFGACSDNKDAAEEQIRLDEGYPELTDSTNGISGNLSFNQLVLQPHTVVLTGMPQHRLVTLYKSDTSGISNESFGWYSHDEQAEAYYETEADEFLLPGIDYIRGYNLLNIAHYDINTDKTNFFFDRPVLVRSLYFPSYEQDSMYKKPINRNYYLVSVYDNDTNADSLITKTDLRRFYRYNADATQRTQLIPPEFSVVRSQYDPANDIMYVFARLDVNKNGTIDKKEPMHTFWISMKDAIKGKRLN
jgi:hypothetical protein